MPWAYAALRVRGCAPAFPQSLRGGRFYYELSAPPVQRCTQIDHNPYSSCVAKKFLRGVYAIADFGLRNADWKMD